MIAARAVRCVHLGLLALALVACAPNDPQPMPSAEVSLEIAPTEERRSGAAEAQPAGGEPALDAPLVAFLGDSLTAGFQLSAAEAYPEEVGRLLAEGGQRVRILNAGVSGDTSAGGLERLGWVLRQRPAVVVVALGANDGLRGHPLSALRANLGAIVAQSRAAGVRVVLAGMKIPPNYGPEYAAEFEAIYTDLARELDPPWIPFLLVDVAAVPALTLPDGLHPNAEGHRRIARTVAEALAPVVEKLTLRGAA